MARTSIRKVCSQKLQQLENGTLERKRRQTTLDPYPDYIQTKVTKKLSQKGAFKTCKEKKVMKVAMFL
jgi:hypothetical protein